MKGLAIVLVLLGALLAAPVPAQEGAATGDGRRSRRGCGGSTSRRSSARPLRSASRERSTTPKPRATRSSWSSSTRRAASSMRWNRSSSACSPRACPSPCGSARGRARGFGGVLHLARRRRRGDGPRHAGRRGGDGLRHGRRRATTDDVLLEKANEDAGGPAALDRRAARAQHRGRAEQRSSPPKSYEETARRSSSGLIDLVSRQSARRCWRRSTAARSGASTGRPSCCAPPGPASVASELSWRHRALETLAHPARGLPAAVLGLLGLYVEFTQPGVVFPGVVGALCLMLFALGVAGPAGLGARACS